MQAQVIIIGGGMVGAALALALGQADFEVILLEKYPPQNPRPQHDIRVSAISRASQNIFEHLGAWSAMPATPYISMKVWESPAGRIEFNAVELGLSDLGHIIENSLIQMALWQQLAKQDQVKIICPAEVAHMQFAAGASQVKLSDGQLLQAELIIAADGAQSKTREWAGIGLRSWSYEQVAVVGIVKAEQGNQATAWQRFMPTGPLALLPLEKDLFAIVWSTSPDEAKRLLALPETDFNLELSAASEYCSGELCLIGPRGGFPLRLQHAQHYIRPGLALVGDAAHVIHPLAGQGVNLGLMDMAELVDQLERARQRGYGLGDYAVLRRYERARKGDNLSMQMAMDAFKRLFSNEIKPLSILRQWGMSGVNRLSPIKNELIKKALGISHHAPALAQPRINHLHQRNWI